MSFDKKNVKFLVNFSIIIVILFTNLTGCGAQKVPLTEQNFLLDTVITLTYYDEADRDAVLEALALCRDYEAVFSRTLPDSELSRLNAADTLEVSDALRTVLETGLSYCEASGGRFDITLGGVSALYDFSGKPRLPAPAELSDALAHVGWAHVHLDGNTVSIDDPETVIDLGAIAKGFIADEMKALLQSRGVKHAIISLGGNVLTLGGKPDGSPFTVGIQYPEKDSSRLVSAVTVSDASVVTSGVYERFFVENGQTYHHLLDPEDGAPLRNGLLAVSVVGPCSMDCDALSTVCFALGLEEGLALMEATDGYEALFITEDQALHPSSGFDALK